MAHDYKSVLEIEGGTLLPLSLQQMCQLFYRKGASERHQDLQKYRYEEIAKQRRAMMQGVMI